MAGVMAAGFEAGDAGQVELQDMVELAVGAGAIGRGGAEEGDDGFAERGGYVHGAGVVGDHELAEPQPLDHLGQGELAGQIEAARAGGGGDGGAEGLLVAAAEDGKAGVGVTGGELAGDMSAIQKYLSRNLGEEVEVDGTVVFISPNVDLTVESDDLPVLKPKDLKKFLADEQKKNANWSAERLNRVADLLENPVK